MKGKLFKVITALLFNAVMGAIIASTLGIHPMWGIATTLTISVGLPLLGAKFIPEGVLQAGVLTEVWTGELIKALRASDTAPWLDGVPDYSQYAENDVIHMIDVGGDPDVLVNNTTYPIAIQTITDSDAVFSLDKFQTKATPVTDDELYATSYDKMTSLKERHAAKINETKYQKAIHALAPDEHAAKTPVLETTGEKVAYGAIAGDNEFQASVAFYKDRVFKASGSTTMYYKEAAQSPEYQRSLINFRHMFIALPKKAEAFGALRSGYVAPVVVE